MAKNLARNAIVFAPLMNLPVVVTGPGRYKTRDGETVEVHNASDRHAFDCRGTYRCGSRDSWHKSGRKMAEKETGSDLVVAMPCR